MLWKCVQQLCSGSILMHFKFHELLAKIDKQITVRNVFFPSRICREQARPPKSNCALPWALQKFQCMCCFHGVLWQASSSVWSMRLLTDLHQYSLSNRVCSGKRPWPLSHESLRSKWEPPQRDRCYWALITLASLVQTPRSLDQCGVMACWETWRDFH